MLSVCYNVYELTVVLFVKSIIILLSLFAGNTQVTKGKRYYVSGEVLEHVDFNSLKPTKWLTDKVIVSIDKCGFIRCCTKLLIIYGNNFTFPVIVFKKVCIFFKN